MVRQVVGEQCINWSNLVDRRLAQQEAEQLSVVDSMLQQTVLYPELDDLMIRKPESLGSFTMRSAHATLMARGRIMLKATLGIIPWVLWNTRNAYVIRDDPIDLQAILMTVENRVIQVTSRLNVFQALSGGQIRANWFEKANSSIPSTPKPIQIWKRQLNDDTIKLNFDGSSLGTQCRNIHP
ncbi:hypothetical protein H6P81_015859 [Aristolochia fimbriata]|uniref:Uncharacterized protein n=1 Tax=Aristolochia fimbriata TaxID=158543 RepID=A0AAV7E8G6_ARIFI|nr:hypothetical protein H6P81_015859 [Aristolochia fimbriata]